MRATSAVSRRSKLGDLSEADILGRIFPRLGPVEGAIVGPGDDAAVLRVAGGRAVMTTDMMVHGPDFRLAWSTPNDLGWKAAASNLADIAAMGAVPTALLVAIAAPADTDITFIESLTDGLRECCAILVPGCGVVGGDLSISNTLTISVAAFGEMDVDTEPVLRSGAKPEDVVAVAGSLGASTRGLRLLRRSAVDSDGYPDAAAATALRQRYPGVVDAHLRPRPPIHLGVVAARAGATAMIDVSDGLAHDAARIGKASGIDIDFRASELGQDPEAILSSAEDHVLLATFSPNMRVPEPFRVIGYSTAGDGTVTLDGESVRLRGWDPYRAWDGALG